jgi:hypothetical protein
MADIVKCVDSSGAVTYTNLPCESTADAVRSPAVLGPAEARNQDVQFAGLSYVGWEAREGAAKFREKKRHASPDVNTVKAARNSSLARDKASSFLRQQNLVALDLRNPGWFDFR